MKVQISKFERNYLFELKSVTQLCGQNMYVKNYILESLRKYFSTYKYPERQNKWRNNIKVDGEIIGRKYFSILSVKNREDILNMIKISKQSLMMIHLKNIMQKFNWQNHFQIISNELEKMFQIMNDEILELGEIELSYSCSEIWDMVQKSQLVSKDQDFLEEKDSYELMLILLNLIKNVLSKNSQKMLIIIENIDHQVTKREYKKILDLAHKIGFEYDTYFIMTTSLDGYVNCSREFISGITIFGDVDFHMPSLEKTIDFIHEYYPYHKEFSEDEIVVMLEKIIQKVGQENYLLNVEENVICKLFNQSLLINDKWNGQENLMEIAFLRSL